MEAYATRPAHTFFHIDIPLLIGLLMLSGLGLVVQYSASDHDLTTVGRQILRLGVGFATLVFLAQVRPSLWVRWIPWIYTAGLGLLFTVLIIGTIGKGAQRWLDLGFFRFQPSEFMKLAVPMMVAWYLGSKPLPPSWRHLFMTLLILFIPAALVIKQPDLGTALLIIAAGLITIFLAGLSWKLISTFVLAGGVFALVATFTPLLSHLLHGYQLQRIKTFFNPEADPLGAGYHIIQSKIAIGSGGFYGKGWLNGTQSHLEFLPERSTDFIFAVFSEEFGFIGVAVLICLYLLIIARALYLATQVQGMFGRLMAGSIAMTFFVYLFVNMGMVSGILPVVGVPLPLFSYGGTSAVSILAGFGILMGTYTHRRLLSEEQSA
jgi:rod shape determining protein RodA